MAVYNLKTWRRSNVLLVNGRNFWHRTTYRYLWFTTYPDMEQHPYSFYACFMALKTCYNRWNWVANMYNSWEACNYNISAAILDFWLLVSSGSFNDSTIEKFDPKNMRIDTSVMFLSRQIAELLGRATLRPLRSSRYIFRSALGGLTTVVHYTCII